MSGEEHSKHNFSKMIMTIGIHIQFHKIPGPNMELITDFIKVTNKDSGDKFLTLVHE